MKKELVFIGIFTILLILPMTIGFEFPFTGFAIGGNDYTCTSTSGNQDNLEEYKLKGDNQEGFNIFIKGNVTYEIQYNDGRVLTKRPYEDKCLNSKKLREYYCALYGDRYKVKYYTINCEQGCENGACISDEAVSYLTCIDSDHIGSPGWNEQDFENPGEVSIGDEATQDQCVNDNVILEAYCDAQGRISQKRANCPEGYVCRTEDNQAYCVEETIEEGTSSCVGPERNNLNVGILATTTYQGESYTDECVGNNVKEYYCENGRMRSKVSACLGLTECNNGVCVSNAALNPSVSNSLESQIQSLQDTIADLLSRIEALESAMNSNTADTSDSA